MPLPAGVEEESGRRTYFNERSCGRSLVHDRGLEAEGWDYRCIEEGGGERREDEESKQWVDDIDNIKLRKYLQERKHWRPRCT